MDSKALIAECTFKAVRSSGPGGQHVNKTSTKVVLSWDVHASQFINTDQKDRILKKLSNKISKDGMLTITDDSSRSQHTNRERVETKFIALLKKSLQKPKKRKKTKPSKVSKLKRLRDKKIQAEKKANRKPPKI